MMLEGKFIGVVEETDVFAVERKFSVLKRGKAVLRVTALGLYFAELNGVRVGDRYLTPGWTSYHNTLQVQEYDVTDLLHEGENELCFTVGKGWYRGWLVYRHNKDIYGNKCAVCAELSIENHVVATDESWSARESYIRESGIYDGETVDFTAELKPLTVCEVEFDKRALVAQMSEPVRNIERLAVKEVIHTPKGELVYDFGQNIAGVAEICTNENFEGTITLQFAECLSDGNFYNDNLREAKATDRFTVKGAKTTSWKKRQRYCKNRMRQKHTVAVAGSY